MLFVLGGLWLHPVTFSVTCLVILCGMLWEYYRIASRQGVRPQAVAGVAASVAIYLLSLLVAARVVHHHYLFSALLVVPAIMIAGLFRKEERVFDSLAHTILPLLYITLPLCLMPFAAFFREGPGAVTGSSLVSFTPLLVAGFFVLIWVNDSAAYITGIGLGRTPLFRRMSPKKTWEGFFGGLVVTAAAGFLMARFSGVMDVWGWILAALVVSVAGTYGDLVESMLKRGAGIKDSGSFMPGHGGFLDRFDSAIISFPLFYIVVVMFA